LKTVHLEILSNCVQMRSMFTWAWWVALKDPDRRLVFMEPVVFNEDLFVKFSLLMVFRSDCNREKEIIDIYWLFVKRFTCERERWRRCVMLTLTKCSGGSFEIYSDRKELFHKSNLIKIWPNVSCCWLNEFASMI
jgi:hypothetical protein